MATCTFFGHRQIHENIEPSLKAALTELIENENVCEFYVGCEGQFDRTAKSVLLELKKEYPHIKITVVLAYLNKQYEDLPDSLFPEGLERVPLRFAIPKRNEWMINHSDFVIAYVRWCYGGSGKAVEYAERKGKTVINLVKE